MFFKGNKQKNVTGQVSSSTSPSIISSSWSNLFKIYCRVPRNIKKLYLIGALFSATIPQMVNASTQNPKGNDINLAQSSVSFHSPERSFSNIHQYKGSLVSQEQKINYLIDCASELLKLNEGVKNQCYRCSASYPTTSCGINLIAHPDIFKKNGISLLHRENGKPVCLSPEKATQFLDSLAAEKDTIQEINRLERRIHKKTKKHPILSSDEISENNRTRDKINALKNTLIPGDQLQKYEISNSDSNQIFRTTCRKIINDLLKDSRKWLPRGMDILSLPIYEQVLILDVAYNRGSLNGFNNFKRAIRNYDLRGLYDENHVKNEPRFRTMRKLQLPLTRGFIQFSSVSSEAEKLLEQGYRFSSEDPKTCALFDRLARSYQSQYQSTLTNKKDLAACYNVALGEFCRLCKCEDIFKDMTKRAQIVFDSKTTNRQTAQKNTPRFFKKIAFRKSGR